jgi:hypothetical protein
MSDLEAEATNLEQIANAGERVFSELVLSTLRDTALRMREFCSAPTQGADARPVATMDDMRMLIQRLAHSLRKASPDNALSDQAMDYLKRMGLIGTPLRDVANRDAAPIDAPKEDAKRLKQLEHALVYVAHSMHSEPQYMLAEGITLGDVSFVRVKIADIDVSVELPESVARAMYDAAMQATATKDGERRIAIAACAPREKT